MVDRQIGQTGHSRPLPLRIELQYHRGQSPDELLRFQRDALGLLAEEVHDLHQFFLCADHPLQHLLPPLPLPHHCVPDDLVVVLARVLQVHHPISAHQLLLPVTADDNDQGKSAGQGEPGRALPQDAVFSVCLVLVLAELEGEGPGRHLDDKQRIFFKLPLPPPTLEAVPAKIQRVIFERVLKQDAATVHNDKRKALIHEERVQLPNQALLP